MKYLIHVLILVVLIVFTSTFLDLKKVAGQSMEPTLKNGQLVIFRRSLAAINPSRADVVLYKKENDQGLHIGRVIGLPLESIRITKGNVYLDDNDQKYRLLEEYLPANTKTVSYTPGDWVKVENYKYFIIGDNRQDVINIKDNFVHRNDIMGIFLLKF
ncbi:signal peptidase I [Candidatus Microgenomates bacterium]|nr:signal peptidase I [Candidatus Microgenomates bacterium]